MTDSVAAPGDLDSREAIAHLIDAFYERVLLDERLGPIFLDVAAVDLAVHLPHIRRYWEKLLLGGTDYRRHTMDIHRALHAKRALESSDFERWLALFQGAVDERYSGPGAERAKRVAAHIARNMEQATTATPPLARPSA